MEKLRRKGKSCENEVLEVDEEKKEEEQEEGENKEAATRKRQGDERGVIRMCALEREKFKIPAREEISTFAKSNHSCE